MKDGIDGVISVVDKLEETDEANIWADIWAGTWQEETNDTYSEQIFDPTTFIDYKQGWEYEDYLLEQVPEVMNVLEKRAEKLSAFAFANCYSSWFDLSDAGYPGKRYASVWIVEKHKDGHQLPMETFYVSEDMDQVLWYNLADGVECLTLEEWRASEHYDEYRNHGASELG